MRAVLRENLKRQVLDLLDSSSQPLTMAEIGRAVGRIWSDALLRRSVFGSLVEVYGMPLDENACRECGCVDAMACEGGCLWYEPDLCSKCYHGSN